MKKTITLNFAAILLFALGFNLSSCSSPLTPLDRMRRGIEVINNNNGKIYLYRNYSEILSGKLNISNVKSLDEISFSNSFTLIVFMVEHYETVIEKEFTQMLFENILMRSENIEIVFLDFPDLNFLEYTKFSRPEANNYYPRFGFAEAFDNFTVFPRRSSEAIHFLQYHPVVVEEHFINSFAAGIGIYNQSQ